MQKKCNKRMFIGVFLIIIGLLIFFKPTFLSIKNTYETKKSIKKFESSNQSQHRKQSDDDYKASVKYNKKLYKNKQKELKDVWSYRNIPKNLPHFKDNIFGSINIPKMNVKLPLYIGATEENMKKGAVIMGQTSLPIGIKNSNTVIAAHRGYQGIPFFREIEKLKVNDKIYIKNKWKTLAYKVKNIKIIYPDDVEDIKIQKNKDMITLLTCHPYRTIGMYRYVVYCIRTDKKDIDDKSISDTIISTEHNIIFHSSEDDINNERILRYFCIILISATIILVFYKRKGKENAKKT